MGKAERKAKKLAKQQERAERERAERQPVIDARPTAKARPALAAHPSATIKPATQDDPGKSAGLKPSWLFRRLDHGGPWSVDAIGENLLQVRDKLKNFETMTWGQLKSGGSHPIPLQNLCAEAQKRLRELKLDMYDEIWSLRITGKQRLWGIKDGGALMLIWWDPEHEVCPSELKHT